MAKYVCKRIILAFMTAFIIITLTFILMKLIPLECPPGTDAARFSFFNYQTILGYVYDSNIKDSTLGTYIWEYTDPASKITHYYYSVPIMKQYFSWLGNIVTRWDWGTSTSISLNRSAIVIIGERIPASMYLNIISSLVAVPIGILLGIWAALKKNSTTDSVISTLVMVLISIPSFILISVLIFIFGYKLNWLPTTWPKATDPIGVKIQGYILPVLALSLGSIAGYCRFTRAELCEVLSSDYLLLARTKGLTKKQAILRHALRNAMVPIVPSILAEFIFIMGGSMILEGLYCIPGIGSLFITALNAKDYNVLLVDMAIFTTFSLLAGVVLDLSYGFIDPRIRMGAKK